MLNEIYRLMNGHDVYQLQNHMYLIARSIASDRQEHLALQLYYSQEVPETAQGLLSTELCFHELVTKNYRLFSLF